MSDRIVIELERDEAGAMNDLYRSLEYEIEGTESARAFEKIGDAYRAALREEREQG